MTIAPEGTRCEGREGAARLACSSEVRERDGAIVIGLARESAFSPGEVGIPGAQGCRIVMRDELRLVSLSIELEALRIRLRTRGRMARARRSRRARSRGDGLARHRRGCNGWRLRPHD